MIQTLKGIKVVDMTIAGAGPAAGRLLRESGADVIMVEPTIPLLGCIPRR